MTNIRKIGLWVIATLLFTQCFAGDTTRIFFIGNSFTYVNDAPALIKGLADAAGEGMYYEQHTPGGVSVGDISQDTLAHWRNPSIFNTLNMGNWDYVVLQDNQGRFIMGYGTFPSTSVSKVIEGHIKIQDSMHYYNPCSHMVLFAGWGPKSGYPPYASTGAGLINNIYANYSFLNDSMHEVISPIGIAWERAMQLLPGTDLWGPDSTHPSLEGSYLTAAVIFSTIFRVNPGPLSFTGGLDSTVASNLRNIAWQTVVDSMSATRLFALNIPLSDSNGTLIAGGGLYHDYQWYKNDSLIPGATNYFTLADSGNCYYITALDSNGCLYRSMPFCSFQTTGIPAERALFKAVIYPNPAHDYLHISIPEDQARLTIKDMAGRTVLEKELKEQNTRIDIANLNRGLYILAIYTSAIISREKILIQ